MWGLRSTMDRLAHADLAGGVATPDSWAAVEEGALPATAYVGIVSNVDGLAALEKGWRALETSAVTPTSAFQTFDWVSNWSRTYASGKQELHILTGYDRDTLVFVWPLMSQRLLGVRILSWLSDPFGQYGDVVCAAGQNPRMWIDNSLRYLEQIKAFDVLRLRHVRADSTLATAAADQFVDARLHERAPWLDLTQFKTEEDYSGRYSSTQRKRRKKIRKHIEELGPITFTRLPPGEASDNAIAQAIDEKNKWLKERGRMNRVLGCPSHLKFLRELSRGQSQGLEVVVSELKAGERPVSWEIGFRYGGRHYAYITSHVNALTDLSPGRLHMDMSQRAALAAGMSAFDLMVPFDAYKESWSSDCVETRDYFLPLSARGTFAGYSYLYYLRPFIRAVYYWLPSHMLRRLRGGKAEPQEG
ncbi:MAG: GNAT family N-acetyltransferase [Proteobacteria bacterium]|nr:GNAT family N-acetyltransferase [Pseudomonadota bacterium]